MKFHNKIVLASTYAAIILILSVSQSFAAAVWCESAKIINTEAHSWNSSIVSSYTITATCEDTNPTVWSGSNTYYIAKGDQAKSMYATALTSMAMKQHVKLWVGGNANPNSMIYSISLLATTY